ncbi:MAG: hypothetical protein LLG01_09770 [Planctomycetaceae bacterium]|nr:hypothetical protein [Planctomycetaceae bacterium]
MTTLIQIGAVLVAISSAAVAQPIAARPVDKWVDATGRASGADDKARDEAVAQALRTAVEEACGVFLTSQSKSEDYKAVYDKVIANAVGYVKEHKVVKVSIEDGVTTARVRARVSTQKFEEDWASTIHTIHQENNPRVIVAIAESVHQTTEGPTYRENDSGTIQSKIEDFFLSKGITIMDKNTAASVSKRDVLLAAIKDDMTEVASLGARFNADVVVTGRATAKYGKRLDVSGQTLYQYTATLNVRVIQTDSARVLASRTFGPVTTTTLQRGGGEDKALAKLGDDCAAQLLAAVVEAWRKRANVSRTVAISVSGMDFETWKTFKTEASTLRGVQALRLREITESVANIDVEYRYSNETLADRLTEVKAVKLAIVEITANRVKLKVQKP